MPDDTCETCHGFGFHFIAARDGNLVNHELQKCDSCDRFNSDATAAHGSDCGYQYTGGQGWMGFGPDKYILRYVPEDSPVAQQNRAVVRAMKAEEAPAAVRDDFVVPAPDRDRVDVDEATGRILLVGKQRRIV